MKAVAKAYQARSLQDFQTSLTAYKEELVDDPVVHLHLSRLYDTLLEQNLCRLIEPYSRVEIDYLAKLIKLPANAVLTKLSQVNLLALGHVNSCCFTGQAILSTFDTAQANLQWEESFLRSFLQVQIEGLVT